MDRRERIRELLERRGLDAIALRRAQAFAWNPSVTGAKAEETFVLTESGAEVVAGAAVALA